MKERTVMVEPKPDNPADPCAFETSRPGIFAVGDVRAGSVKRVASGVGEGSVCVSDIHKVLAELYSGSRNE